MTKEDKQVYITLFGWAMLSPKFPKRTRWRIPNELTENKEYSNELMNELFAKKNYYSDLPGYSLNEAYNLTIKYLA
jgi:hypothetical protein